jgi:hypothetical protein
MCKLTCRHHDEYGYSGQIDELYPKEVGVRMKPLKDGQLQQHYLVGRQVVCPFLVCLV